jgi:hypothetical protein
MTAGGIDEAALAHERERQQQLLQALWRRDDDAALQPWLSGPQRRAGQGIAAYRGNATAIAERALATAYPTVAQLLGDVSFAQLAQALWHHEPPQCGDLARYGEALIAWIAADTQLASEPYLADVARVDWAVHTLEHAADVPSPPPGLPLLGELEPSQLVLRLRPGLACIESRWPVVIIWQAHRARDGERFAPAQDAFARAVAETALVWRDGWRADVTALQPEAARFFRSLLQGCDLAAALDVAGEAFDFTAWLHDALRQQWLQAVEPA